MTTRRLTIVFLLIIAALLITSARKSTSAATLCVNPGGTGGCFASIQAAITAAMPGDIINVAPGTYTENITLNKSVTLNGAQAGVDACGRVVGAPNPAVESIITAASGTLLTLQTGSAGAVINGFTFSGGARAIESGSGPLNNLQIVNNHLAGFTGNGIFLNDTGIDITINQNSIDGGSKTGSGGLFHLDTDVFHGFRFTDNCVLGKGAADLSTGFFVDGNHNVSTSTTPRKPVISGNSISNCQTGMNLGSRAFGSQTVANTGTISKNTFSNNLFDGLQGGMQNTLITGNLFTNNGRAGLALTSFGNTGADRGAQNCMVTCNTFTGNGFTNNSGDTAGGGITYSATQAVGTIATNHTNNNNISGNFAGARYSGTETIDAENNWWGSATGPTVASNPGGTGDRIVGTGAAFIDYDPFRTAVIPDSDGDGLLDPCEPGCAQVPPNIVSWWPGNGNANDIRGTNNGTLVNGATFATGKIGQAFSFDGIDDRVDVPFSNSLNLTGSQLTLDGWINPTTNTSGTIYFGRSQNSDHPYMIFFATGGIHIAIRAGGTQLEYDTAYVPALNTWTHIALVYDGAMMRFYANGLQVFSGLATGTLDSSPLPFAIGNRTTDPLTSFNGLIDDVEVYSRALTPIEIQALVNADEGGKCDCLSITCPANITQANDPNQCGAVVTYPAPTPGGTNCGPSSCSPASGSFFPVGTTIVTCTSSAGPTCTFTVTVNDTQPPTITCPENITQPNATDQCGALVTYPPPTITDNCPGSFTAFCIPASGSFFPVGTTTVNCSVNTGEKKTSAAPNGNGCPTTITHSTSQVITPGNSISCNNEFGHAENSYWRAFNLQSFSINTAFAVQSVDIGIESAVSNIPPPKGKPSSRLARNSNKTNRPSGAGQGLSVRLYVNTGGAFPNGTRILLSTADFTIPDQSGTILNLPISGTVPANSELVVEIFTPNGQTDGNLLFIGSNSAAETGPSYLSALECGIAVPTPTADLDAPDMHIVMNVNGCPAPPGATCSFTVTVQDTQAPTITCPEDFTQSTDPNQCTAVVQFLATTSDNCPCEESRKGPHSPNGGGGCSVTCMPPSGSTLPIGPTTVTCTATDASGNQSMPCSFTVTVQDMQPPTITCPPNQTVSTAGGSVTVNYPPPTVTDNCSLSCSGNLATPQGKCPPGSVTCTPPSGSTFLPGTTTVTCTACDCAGNSASCSFTVTVVPCTGITCPANVTQTNDPNQCGAVVNYPPPTPVGSDCGTITCSPASGSFFPVGTTTVTCTSSVGPACTFTVTVTDDQPPSITCPPNQTRSNDPNQCGAVVNYPPPTITDNCPGTFTATCTPPSGSFFPVGTTTVTCSVNGGGAKAPSTNVPNGGCAPQTITQSTSQAITPLNSVSCNDGVGHTNNSYWRAFSLPAFSINTAFDVQSIDIGIEEASAGQGGSGQGGSGKGSKPSAASKPSISGKKSSRPSGPASQPITVNIYTSSTTFPTGFPGSLTLIGTASVMVADQSGTILNVPITGTAPAGSQLVVEVFTPDGQAAGNLFFIGSNAAAETGPSYLSAADCGITTPTTTAAIGFPDMHIVMNVNGCVQGGGTGPTCTFTVTVNDTQPPTITCPANVVAVAAPTCPANSGTAITYPPPTASDNCPGVTVVCVPPSGTIFPVGTTTVTCTATDASNNTATCSFSVKIFNICVQDRANPAAVLAWNTTTGEYVFCCNGSTFTGVGKARSLGCTYTLEHTTDGRRVTGKIDLTTFRGEGALQVPAGTSRCTISDNDVRDNNCSCIGGGGGGPQ